MSGITLAYVHGAMPSAEVPVLKADSQPPYNIIYANTVIINVTKDAHADQPKKKKSSGIKTKIGLSMFRAAADTYLEEKSKEDDRK